eukprot:TRINITY_DN54191_c0_g1_i1.p1 TRINITY_DN54191_c0_g1~~TRINITY_DN54191_c0_g1_i1.p1  ORF type:complete len:147 (+),score=33.51 TRINITY_DN54191_c0_g1_i1:54-443(+)
MPFTPRCKCMMQLPMKFWKLPHAGAVKRCGNVWACMPMPSSLRCSSSNANRGNESGKVGSADAKSKEEFEIFLPHHLLPWGSPIFYFALVAVPALCIYNEMQDAKEDAVNTQLREERLRRRAERQPESE